MTISTRWSAPELLRREHYTNSIDVYSFGIVLWEVFAGELPFADLEWASLVESAVLRGERPHRPRALPHDALWELMATCWADAAEARPAFDVILRRLQGISRELGFLSGQSQSDDASRENELLIEGD